MVTGNKVRIQFLGAAGTVTGSRTLVENTNYRFYVDAGLYQGPKHVEEKNYLPLETEPSKISDIYLTHAHIDHSGLLPLLIKKGFQGKIYCTPATSELLQIMLPDAGHIQEEEFKFLSKKKIKTYDLDGPLFTRDDALKTLSQIETIPFNTSFKKNGFEFTYYWAGHILGGAHLRVTYKDTSILFSGDIGPEEPMLHKPREIPSPSNYIIMESTYGNRKYEREDHNKKLQNHIRFVVEKKSMLIIPSFAVGRAQLVLFVLFQLLKEKKIPEIPVFIDSPMATRATRAYLQFPEEMRDEVRNSGFFEFLGSKKINLIEDVSESKNINYFSGPGIIISAGGMCNGGRIMHHLFNRLWDRRNVLLFVGYQGEGTIGRQILEGANRVKIFNREIPVRCTVDVINSFSAHADKQGLINWARNFKNNPPLTLFINHGENESREELAKSLSFLKHTRIEMPKGEQVYYL